MEAGKARRRAEGRHGWRRWGSEGEGAVKREGEGVWWESGRGGDRRPRRGSGIGFGDPFIQSKHNFIHPSTDERSKMIGLFGSKRVNYISPLLNFFLFLFSFLCNKEIITI
jgi:hypothetical protein